MIERTKYVIITPTYNEEHFIGKTIESVIIQTIKPIKWIIVNDGSTDNTRNIIDTHIKGYDWIVCHTKIRRNTTYYSNNVFAIIEGIEFVKDVDYDFLCILDADITLCNDYYQKIFHQFSINRKLGVASGTYLEKEGNKLIEARIDRRSTPKAIQVIRKKCYQQTNGYIPFLYGGEDAGLEIMARMKGWETWSFNDIKVLHNRPVGTGDGSSILYARFRLGITDYTLGVHPIFLIAKSIKRCFWEKPFILSGFARLMGFIVASYNDIPVQLPCEAVKYLRKEQINRLIHQIKKFV